MSTKDAVDRWKIAARNPETEFAAKRFLSSQLNVLGGKGAAQMSVPVEVSRPSGPLSVSVSGCSNCEPCFLIYLIIDSRTRRGACFCRFMTTHCFYQHRKVCRHCKRVRFFPTRFNSKARDSRFYPTLFGHLCRGGEMKEHIYVLQSNSLK